MIWQILGSFVAVMGFSIILEVPRKYVGYAGVVGAFGWFVYLVLSEFGYSVLVCNFVAAILISIGAQILARICKTLVTIFNIAGIMPLVPGAGMYRIVYYTLNGDSSLASFYVNQTMQIAGMISIGIFLVDVIFRQFLKKKQ